jgi:hypothetical protein
MHALIAALSLSAAEPTQPAQSEAASSSAQIAEAPVFEPRLRFGVGSWAGAGGLRIFQFGYMGASIHAGVQFDDNWAVFIIAQGMWAFLIVYPAEFMGTASVMLERTFFDHVSVGIGGGIVGNAAEETCSRCLGPSSPNLGFNVPLRLAYNFGTDVHQRHRCYLAVDGGVGFPLAGAGLRGPTLFPGFYAAMSLGYVAM